MAEERQVSLVSGGITSFTLTQVLLEKLVERGVLSVHDVMAIIDESIHLNRRPLPFVAGNQNSDTVYLLEELKDSLQRVFDDRR